MKIISGRSHVQLAKRLAINLGAPYVHTQIETFNDLELRIQILEPLYEQDVVIVQSTSKPANDYLMELLLLVDTAKRAGAKRIIAVVPYFGYGRQDRPSYDYGPISARLVATLLEAAGVDHLITLDFHSKQLLGFFKIGVQNVEPLPLFTPHVKDLTQSIIISPDIGGLIRARKFSETFNINLAIINKSRDASRTCHMSEIIGNVCGKHCILIDDIVDTAGTLCQAAELLMQQGAVSVEAFITHGVLSGEAIERIQRSAIRNIFITDSIVNGTLPDKFKVVSVVNVLSDALRRLNG